MADNERTLKHPITLNIGTTGKTLVSAALIAVGVHESTGSPKDIVDPNNLLNGEEFVAEIIMGFLAFHPEDLEDPEIQSLMSTPAAPILKGIRPVILGALREDDEQINIFWEHDLVKDLFSREQLDSHYVETLKQFRANEFAE